MKEYFDDNNLPIDELGVVVVATNAEERSRLNEIQQQADENGVETELLHSQDELREYEPHAAGEAALYCPEAASVDAQKYVYLLAGDAENRGVDFFTGYEVEAIHTTADAHHIQTTTGTITSSYLINAAGLYADKHAHEMDVGMEYQIVPFRSVGSIMNSSQRNVISSSR